MTRAENRDSGSILPQQCSWSAHMYRPPASTPCHPHSRVAYPQSGLAIRRRYRSLHTTVDFPTLQPLNLPTCGNRCLLCVIPNSRGALSFCLSAVGPCHPQAIPIPSATTVKHLPHDPISAGHCRGRCDSLPGPITCFLILVSLRSNSETDRRCNTPH